MIPFPERIKMVRAVLGLSQKEFGRPAKLTQGYISQVEIGKKTISDRSLELLSIHHEIRFDYLKHCKGEMFTGGAPRMDDEKPDEAAAGQLLRNIFRSGNEVYIKAIVSNLSALNEAIMTSVRAANYQPPEGMVLIKNRRKKDDPDFPPEKEKRAGGQGHQGPVG